MGGDHGAQVVVPAALHFLKRYTDVNLILVGREEVIREHLRDRELDERIRIHHASQQVEMDEHPSKALRGKKDSSMRVAIDLVKAGTADACVSAGNTGALTPSGRASARLAASFCACVLDTSPTITTVALRAT